MTDTSPTPDGQPGDLGHRARVALAVAAAVDSVVGARRSGGAGVEVATQYRGGRVIGVRLGVDLVEVHIVAERPDITGLTAGVHRATREVLDTLGDRRAVAVVVDDLDLVSGPAGSP